MSKKRRNIDDETVDANKNEEEPQIKSKKANDVQENSKGTPNINHIYVYYLIINFIIFTIVKRQSTIDVYSYHEINK